MERGGACPEPGPVCVFCRLRPVDPVWRPFCSERCKVRDLAQWATGGYRVPAAPGDASHDDDVEDEHED